MKHERPAHGVQVVEYRAPTDTYAHRDIVWIQLGGLYVQRMRTASGDLAYRALLGAAVAGEWHATVQGACEALGRAIGRTLPKPVSEALGGADHLPPCGYPPHEPRRVYGVTR